MKRTEHERLEGSAPVYPADATQRLMVQAAEALAPGGRAGERVGAGGGLGTNLASWCPKPEARKAASPMKCAAIEQVARQE